MPDVHNNCADAADPVWQRFVTVHREDQDLLNNEFPRTSAFRPIVSNYQGNSQAVITHPKGEAERYARQVGNTLSAIVLLGTFTSLTHPFIDFMV